MVAISRWRTPEDARGLKGGLIGPNAVLQMVPVLEAAGIAGSVMEAAGIEALPSDQEMMPEGPAARLHQALRRVAPAQAPGLSREAGRRTADYILAHRIPGPAQTVLHWLPPALSGPLLTRAIAQHAWTFAGSGRFSVAGKLVFEIADNPIVRGETAKTPLCHWHAAVFEWLFRVLVDDRLRAYETRCCACGDAACRFELRI